MIDVDAGETDLLTRRQHRTRTAAAVLGVLLAGSLAVAAPASARPLERGHFHDEDTLVFHDLCGVEGLTVTDEITADGSFNTVAHGPDGLYDGLEVSRRDQIITDVATGAWVRVTNSGISSKDLQVIDNGDGTLTITNFGAGNTVMYDSDGNVIAHDPGMTRVQILVDDAGTPTDPSDDQFLEFLGVVLGSTGLNADFCAANLAAWGLD